VTILTTFLLQSLGLFSRIELASLDQRVELFRSDRSINENFDDLDQRISRVEGVTTQTVAVDCASDAAALKNLTLVPNSTYILTGICDGQITVGAGLGTINIEGDGGMDDGITLPAGETDGGTVFGAVYGTDAVRLNLSDLVIDASSYNSESDLFAGAVLSTRAAHVTLTDVNVTGGDYGVGAYNTGTITLIGNVSITDFGLNGVRADKGSVVRTFGDATTLTIIGGTGQDWTASEAVVAYQGGVVQFDNDGNDATRHSIQPASGPNLNSDPDDNVAAVSAFQNGTIRIYDANITGVVWSGDSSVVDLRDVVQGGGYVNPYRNSVLRFRDSQIGNGAAGEFFSGDFSVLRMDDTEVKNSSGSDVISTYRYGVIDLRGATNLNGRGIVCQDTRDLRLDGTVINVGATSGC
jgi:hypothetical protein